MILSWFGNLKLGLQLDFSAGVATALVSLEPFLPSLQNTNLKVEAIWEV